jgi:integrase
VDGKKIFGYGRTPEEAEADLNEKLKAWHSVSLPTRPTLHEVACSVWLPTIQHLEPTTQKRYEGSYRNWIRTHLGAHPVDQVTRARCQTFVNILGEKMSAKSVRNVYGTLHQILAVALNDGLISSNPCLGLKLPRMPEKRERVLEISEAIELLEHMRGTPVELPVYLAMVLGLRRGEISGLKWSDLDRQRRTLRIRRQRTGVTQRGVIEKDLKTRSSKRNLILPSSVIDFIDAKGNLDQDYIVNYPVPDTITEHWIRYRPQSLSEWHFHDLRHLAAGLLAAAGANLIEIAAVLGHAKPDMSFVYTSVTDTQASSALERLGKLLVTGV